MQKPETKFINSIHRRLTPYADLIETVRLNTPNHRSRPDYLYLCPSTNSSVFVEYKVHPNTLTPSQRNEINTLRRKGHKVAIITKAPTNTTTIDDGTTLIYEDNPYSWILKTLGVHHATTEKSRSQRPRMD